MAPPAKIEPERDRAVVLLAIGGLGASAVMTQLASMRELLAAFSGNELVLGISLGAWLLLTGAGAWLGRALPRVAAPERVLVGAQISIALLPLLQVVAGRMLRDVVFGRGAAVGVTGTVFGCLALLLPFCAVSGGMLTLACGLLARRAGPAGIGRVYVADCAGGIAGGVAFSFALVPWFDHFALLCFPAFLNLLLAVVLAHHFRAPALVAAALVAVAALAILVATVNVDEFSTQWQYRGQVVFRANSPYGRLVVTRDGGQLTFFENGVPAIFSHNVSHVEETVHYAMSQRPEAREVLLLSGGVAGTAREVLRYGVRQVTCVEIDPRMIDAARQLLPENLADPRITLVATDSRRFVQRATGRYEVVILDVPDPSTFQLNRFFTAEFFAEVKRVLPPGGVFAFGLGHYENYVSPGLQRLLASAHRTLEQSFAHVRMIPGGRVYFLASDGALHPDIAARLEPHGLALRLVNRHYLDATLTPDRLADLIRAVAGPAEINTDFDPVLYFLYLRHWLSQFAWRSGLLGTALLLALAVYLVRLPAAPRVIFASGFAASVLEVVVLLGVQVFYGSLYRQVGLVVTVFMAGLAVGAAWSNRHSEPVRPDRALVVLALAVSALAATLPFVLPHLGHLDTMLGTALAGQMAILVFTFLVAALVGGQFPLAGRAAPEDATHTASRLFTADLAGAALGALLVSTVLIPWLGVMAVCLLTGGLNLAAAALAWLEIRRA